MCVGHARSCTDDNNYISGRGSVMHACNNTNCNSLEEKIGQLTEGAAILCNSVCGEQGNPRVRLKLQDAKLWFVSRQGNVR